MFESPQDLILPSLVLPIVTLITIILLINFRFLRRNYEGKNIPPGSFGLPFIGETLSFVKAQKADRGSQWIEERVSKYGPIFKTKLMGSPTVIVAGQAGHKYVFTADGDHLGSKQPPSIVKISGKNNIFELTGSRYKLVKGAMLSFLKAESLQHYIGQMDDVVRTQLLSQINDGDTIKAVTLMKKVTFNVTCSLLFGLYDEPMKEALFEDFSQAFKGVWSVPVDFPGTPYHRGIKSRSRIVDCVIPIIRERREDLGEGRTSARSDVMSCLLALRDENDEPLGEDEIIDNFVTLMIASHDTTAILLSLMVWKLARDPKICNQVLEEQLGIMKERQGGKEGKVTWSEVQKMKYTWRVAQELMRVVPPVFGNFRKALKDLNYGGYDIPKGWQVFWEASSTHMNPDMFEEPMEFNPCRFESGGPTTKTIPPFTYTPFGAGQRMCIGNEFARVEVLVIIHRLVTEYEWRQLIPDEPITRDPMPYPAKGLPININVRNTI